MKRFGKYCWFSMLPALLFSGVASATTLIVNCSTVSGPTEFSAAGVVCPQFNVSGEILSNISIAVSGGISGSITLTNGDTSSQTGSGTATKGLRLGALTGFSFVNPIFQATFTTTSQTLAAGRRGRQDHCILLGEQPEQGGAQ